MISTEYGNKEAEELFGRPTEEERVKPKGRDAN